MTSGSSRATRPSAAIGPTRRPVPSSSVSVGLWMEASIGEDELVQAREDVRRRLGSGPTVVRGEQSGRVALAPYLAAAALAPFFLVLWRRDR